MFVGPEEIICFKITISRQEHIFGGAGVFVCICTYSVIMYLNG